MLESVLKAFNIPEVRKRALFTLGAIIVFRIGAWIPVPGVDLAALKEAFGGILGGGVLQFLNMFTGGALERFSLFALGVIPYINASIILSLLTAVIPKLKELQKQGEEGRKVINRYTRYGTVLLAVLQGVMTSLFIAQGGAAPLTFSFILLSVIALATGTMFLMWLGERITENGIGRGVSMIIMAGIIADYPRFTTEFITLIDAGTVHPLWVFPLLAVFVIVVAGVVIIQLGARRVDIQYARRIVQGRVYGGHHTYIPIGVNQGGVIPIIFATALLILPGTLFQFLGQMDPPPAWLSFWGVQSLVNQGTLYLALGALLIIFFTYFYSAIVFDPRDLADNLRKWGGFIAGVRPGRPTTEYVEKILAKLLLIGALFLVGIWLLPYILIAIIGNPSLSLTFALGGTSILIVVGVGVDTVKQIEAHMLERYYESFIAKAGGALGRRA